MSRAFDVFLDLGGGQSEAFCPFDTPTLNTLYQSTICPTPRVTASPMVVPRTTTSLMSGEFGGASFAWLEVGIATAAD